MVTIPLSSNIVNFFYIVLFDVTMPVALTWFSAILLSSVNLKIIHDDRKVLWLRQVPVPHLFNPGLSTRLIGLAVSFASALVVVLSIIGSFSINGVTTRRSKQVSYILDSATSEDALDLSQHIYINETGTYESSTYLALYWGGFCSAFSKNGRILYSSFVDTEKPQSEWTSDLVQNSLKCRVAYNGLETKILARFKYINQPLPWLDRCNVTVPPQPQGSVMKVNPTLKGECPFRMLEFFCANGVIFSCAGWIESKGEILLFAKEFSKTQEIPSDALFNEGYNYVEDAVFSEKPPTESLRSIAYLISTNTSLATFGMVSKATLTVKRGGKVKTLETVQETIVNETLFLSTIVPALVITAGFALGAYTSRYLYRTKPGRSDYNSFLSARDMLFCALDEATGERNAKLGSSNYCFVSTLDDEPYLFQQKDEKDSGDVVYRGLWKMADSPLQHHRVADRGFSKLCVFQ